ncbi:MAG: glycosyltransferase family 4 protein, partial [Comamonas sp.]
MNFRKFLIELLVSQHHEVYVFASDYTPQTKKSIQDLGATPVSYQISRGGLNPFADIKSTWQLKRIISEIAPDIVFSYFSKPVIFGTIAAKLAKVPRIIGMLEGLGFAFTKNSQSDNDPIKKIILKKIQILLYRFSFKYLDRIIFLNSDDYSDLIIKNRIPIKTHSILGGIGVDLNKFSSTAPCITPIRFIFIGRLLREKGIYEYIEAATRIKKIHPDTEFIVLGNIVPENPSALTQKQLKSLLQDGTIIHPGHVNDVKEWLQRSSVFVLPSYREGVPCSTQEALA